MPRIFVHKVFDDDVIGTTSVYTSPEFEALLGSPDRLAIQAVVDSVAGTSPNITVAIEHSSDRRNWTSKTNAIDNVAVSAASTNNVSGYDAGGTPSHGNVRLRIALGGTSPEAHVEIYVTGRELFE